MRNFEKFKFKLNLNVLFTALEVYIENELHSSPEETTRFLIKSWNSSSLDSNEKYEVILKYLLRNIGTFPEHFVNQILEQKFSPNLISHETVKSIVKTTQKRMEKNPTLDNLETCATVILNDSYKEYFKVELTTYCKLIGSILKLFVDLQCDNFKILDNIVRELHYFARTKNFPKLFREYVLIPMHQLTICLKYEKVNDIWSLIESIYFSRSYSEENSNDARELFNEEVTFEQMEVLIESFIISFKADSREITKLLNHFDEDVLSRYESNNESYLNLIKMLYTILKKHDVEVASIKNSESAFDKISKDMLTRVINTIHEIS